MDSKLKKCDRCGLIFDPEKAVECRKNFIVARKNEHGFFEAANLCSACRVDFNDWMYEYED